MVHPSLLSCLEPLESQQVHELLRRLGVHELEPQELLEQHIYPTIRNNKWKVTNTVNEYEKKKKISDLFKKKIGWIFFLLSLISVYPFHWSQSLHLWLWVTWFSSSSTRPLARSTQTPQYPSSPPGVCCAHPMKGCISLKSTETSTYHRSCLVRRIPQLLLKERITACVGVRRTASHFATQLHIKSSFSWRFPHNQLTLIKSAVNNTCSLLCSGLAAAPLACVKGTATALPPNLNISVPVTILIIF